MQQVIREGLELAEQMAALPFKIARESLLESQMGRRPLGEVAVESLTLGEGLARLPFKAANALWAEAKRTAPDLEARVARLEQVLGVGDQDGVTTAE